MKLTRKQRKNLIRIIASALLLVGAAAIGHLIPMPEWARLCIFVVPYLICGYDVLFSAGRNIANGQVFDENFLMSIATVGAFGIGEYPEAVAVMLFYQVGELFQAIAVGKSRRAVRDLMDICPEIARVVRDGAEIEVSPDEVEKGEIIIVRPGDKIPLDGEVIEGSSAVNTSALTGESVPRDVFPGEQVISGCVNMTGVLHVKVSGAYEDSTVARILELVENSTEKKARTENFITKFAKVYTPIVVISALCLAVIPPIFLGIGDLSVWANWLKRALVFLVVSCPCALVVSVPLSFFGAIGGACRRGILIKGANYIEALSQCKTVVFDKTGTLTKGEFSVTAVSPAEGIDETELLRLAAAAESMSAHPIARSVAAKYGESFPDGYVTDVKEHAGCGVEALAEGRKIAVGNLAMMKKAGAEVTNPPKESGLLHVSADGVYLGSITISDNIKPDADSAIADLKHLGIEKTVMLTGDSRDNAEKVAAALGIDEFCASLLPADKVEKVESLLSSRRGDGTLAFVGDGINDAPVLSRADVGIAMGALGSDAAIEAADIVLMNDRPSDIPRAISLSRRTMAIVRQNIAFSLGVKGAILLLSVFGYANMWLAVFADVGVMVLAILNSTRTLIQRVVENIRPE